MSTTERESLTCPRCSHELASDKTIGRLGDVMVTCAKCKEASALGAWRVAYSRRVPPPVLMTPLGVPVSPGGKEDDSPAASTEWSRFCYEAFLGLSAIAVGLAVAVFVLAALYNMAEAESATDSLNAIAHNLAFFRWAFLAVLACKVFKAVLATLNAQPKADPASSHPIL